LANHGATDHEIMAWGGWSSLSEVQRYTNKKTESSLKAPPQARSETLGGNPN
jgi:hypothetical protein